jgi:hypothetical protein
MLKKYLIHHLFIIQYTWLRIFGADSKPVETRNFASLPRVLGLTEQDCFIIRTLCLSLPITNSFVLKQSMNLKQLMFNFILQNLFDISGLLQL